MQLAALKIYYNYYSNRNDKHSTKCLFFLCLPCLNSVLTCTVHVPKTYVLTCIWTFTFVCL